MYTILVFERGFSPRSPEPGGDFENPRGHGVLPEGIFKIPDGRWGSGEIPDQKPEFCTYFFNIHNIYIIECLLITTYHTQINLDVLDSISII